MMKKTGIFLVVAVIVSLSTDCDAVPVRRQERVVPEHRSQQAKQQQGHPAGADMIGQQILPLLLTVYPWTQNYNPALVGLEDPNDSIGLEDYRSGQKKQGRKDQPAGPNTSSITAKMTR